MLLTFVVVLSLGTACKKNKDCECTIAGITTTTPELSKSECDKLSDAAAIGGGKCELK